MDVGELLRFGVLHRPQGLTPYDKGKHVLGPLPGLAYLHCIPFIDGRLLCLKELPNVMLPIESSADVDSTGIVDPQRGCSVSNVTIPAADGHLQDLCVSPVVVAFWIEFEGHPPLLGEDGNGCQKCVPL